MSQELAPIPGAQEFQTMKELATMAIKSQLLPQAIKTPEQAVIIMLKGRELGIPPMQAFSSIAVVQGKPTMSAELMLSMIYKNIPGAIVNFLETTNEACVIEAKRPHGKPTKFSFLMTDARQAGLADKGPWKAYPAAMLRARCISAMARALFPDALNGVSYTPEELGAETIEVEGITIEPEKKEIPKPIESQPIPIPQPQATKAAHVITQKSEATVVSAPGTNKTVLLQNARIKGKWTMDQFQQYAKERYDVDSSGKLSDEQVKELCQIMTTVEFASAMAQIKPVQESFDPSFDRENVK